MGRAIPDLAADGSLPDALRSEGGDVRSAATADAATRHLIEVRKGARFEFGKNWARFLRHLTAERIATAERSLQEFLGLERLDGKSFIDIGSGSGLFSLVARRLGARVHSFDYDPHSVACARELRRRFFPQDPDWTIEQGSALDSDYLASLGQFDIVYSWGVLHHTGAMYQALENVKPLVPVGGKLFIAIYNDLGAETDRWERIKRRYNRLPRGLRFLYALRLIAQMEGPAGRAAWRTGRLWPWIRSLHDYGRASARGMSRWHDYIDWVGGYPYERATVQRIADVYARDGFRLVGLHDSSAGFGCNQFVFDRVAPAGIFIDSPIPGGNSVAWRFGRRVIGPFERDAEGRWSGFVPSPPQQEPGAALYLIRDERLVGPVVLGGDHRVALPVADDDAETLEAATLHVVAARQRALHRPFNHIRGLLWEAGTRELASLADVTTAPRRSPAFLFEDGQQLPRAHVRHDEIAEKGQGRFSHWGGSFYFSPSDSSDPNDNGRNYLALVAADRLPPERAAGRRHGVPLTGAFEKTEAGWLAPLPATMAATELVLLRDDRLAGPCMPDTSGRILVAPVDEPEERLKLSRFDLVCGRIEPLAAPFRHHGGQMWSVAMPDLAAVADSSEQPSRSPVFVFENGYQLPYPHTGHKIIGEFGGGRFSHWGGTLYFSTLTGEDPNQLPDAYNVLIPASATEVAGVMRANTPTSAQDRLIDLPGPFEHEAGSCYVYPLKSLAQPSCLDRFCDGESWPLRSPAILLEDGRLLGPPHAQHALIRSKGDGAYSHWGDKLYFSASDNSDPNSNGRAYQLRIPPPAAEADRPSGLGRSAPPAVSALAPSIGLADTSSAPRCLYAISEFAAELGFCYTARLPASIRGDSELEPHRSPLRLIEDGVELGPAHSPHDTVRELGAGRYSHWGDTLYFSASDNSNPLANGRSYLVYIGGNGGQSSAASEAIEVLRRLPQDFDRNDAYAAIEAALRPLDPKIGLPDPHKLLWENEAFARDYARVCGRDRRAMERKYTVYQLVKGLAHIPGELAECGTRNGETAYFMALAGREIGRERPLHIFDSFEGLSQPSEFDGSYWHAGGLAAPETNLIGNVGHFGCLLVHRGWIPSRFAEVAERRFCFVHVDVDLYEPTRDSIEFFYPRLEPGGILLCDDYGSAFCPGARKAIDDFFRDKPEHVIDLPTMQGFIIKR